jgi:hypothetical protein
MGEQMNGTERRWGIPSLGRFACVAIAICSIAGSAASSAAAQSFTEVGVFAGSKDVAKEEGGVFGERVQLGGVGGMAVNVDGAGGVPAGTIYAATSVSGDLRVARFNPNGSFSEAWKVRLTEPPERCGPDSEGGPACAARVQAGPGRVDIDIDQQTGNVYVLEFAEEAPAEAPLVTVYNATGSKVLDRFAPRAALGETTTASPGKVHSSPYPGGLAVNDAGEVYVFDVNFEDNFAHRLMVFKPESPGDYEHYVYAGQAQDIAASPGGHWPFGPVVDSDGNIYVGGAGDNYVEEYDPAQPGSPICEFTFGPSGITSLTVNPATGEPFFFSYKAPKRIHQLSACKEGKFAELGTIEVKPERADLYGLAFDPVRKFSLTREPGVLIGGAPGPEPGIGKGQPGQSSLGYMFAPVEELSPTVESQSVTNVGATSATLKATINPEGSLTRYLFQYLSDPAFKGQGEDFDEAQEAPLGGGDVGSGSSGAIVAAAITGLEQDTVYHFRVVATSHCAATEPSKICETVSTPQQFRTFASAIVSLPDKRAWEMVSPVEKSGGQVLPAEPSTSSCGIVDCKPGITYGHFPMQSAPDGNAVVYEGMPFTPSGAAVIENEYLARRTVGGWSTVNLSPPLLASGSGQGYKAFDTDLSVGLFEQINRPLQPEAPAGYADLYRQPTSSPTVLSPLLTSSPPNRDSGIGANAFRTTYGGAAADLSRIFFEANDALTTETPFAPAALDGGEGKLNLYEWSEGQLSLVNVLPGNTTTVPGSKFGGPLSSGSLNAISEDGSHAFWSSEGGQVYVRVNGQETVEIKDGGKFLSTAADGSTVLLANGCLYNLEEAECEDLTGGSGGFQGIVGQNEDLSHVYFVIDPGKGSEGLSKGTGDLSQGSTTLTDVHATSGAFTVGQTIEAPGIPPGTTIVAVGTETVELSAATTVGKNDVALIAGVPLAAAEENSEGAKPKLSGLNLYAWVDGTTKFVATLLAVDGPDWQASPAFRTAEASPDGRFAAFVSQAALTGRDNIGPCKIISGTTEYEDGPCAEVFLYDSVDGNLICASCSPSGAAPVGGAVLRLIKAAPTVPQARYLTDSGRLFFDSRDSLVPADTNGGVEDVYEYELRGIGDCAREGGCIALISAGRERSDSNFLAADPSGDNVFFTTRDRLVPADGDEQIDLYDARVDGGFPESSPSTPCNSAESCQPVGPPTPEQIPGPGPAEGNFKPPKSCKKGQVKKNGHCVKKKSSQKKSKGKRTKHSRGGSK